MRSVWRQTFDGHNRRVDRRDLRLAGPSGLPADVDRAGTALPDTTSELRSLHVENVSENPEKGHVWRYVDRLRLPIHRQFIGHTSISSSNYRAYINLLIKRIERRSGRLATRHSRRKLLAGER